MLNALDELRRIRAAIVPVHRLPVSAPTKPTKAELTTQPEAISKGLLPAFDPAASAVLRLVACAGKPLPHPAIVATMAGQGYSKAIAREAIASCQAKRWIEHNLTTGYVLTGESEPAE